MTLSAAPFSLTPPDQWGVFIAEVRTALNAAGQTVLPYVLLEGW